MDFLPSAFLALELFPQFIIYKLVPNKNKYGKTDKLPLDYRTGQLANAHDPAVWTTAETAISIAKTLGKDHGVGYVFTKKAGFFFIDIDNCLDACGTKWNETAMQIMAQFPGAAMEVSSSGKGLHIIGRGQIEAHGCRNNSHGVELYTDARFVALTGYNAVGDAATEHTQALYWLNQTYFPQGSIAIDLQQWTNTPHPQWSGPVDDAQLIERALKSNSSRSIFGGGASFADLWNNNTVVLAKIYDNDESRMDAALAQHLAFWTGNDCERMQRLMQQSQLVRDKWEREDYLPRTILAACSKQTVFCIDKQPEKIEHSDFLMQHIANAVRGKMVSGSTFINFEAQLNLFAGCTYIAEDNAILIPGGAIYNQAQFKAIYGGFTFPMDLQNTKTTKNAFEAFTESQAIRHPKVHGKIFKPDMTPGLIIEKEGEKLVNTYFPIMINKIKGDATPFINHLRKLTPVELDNTVWMSYLASLVQYKGVKFQWCPIIQGVEGNGKTIISRIVAYAVGERYTHYPKAFEITSRFNDWMPEKILIVVEDFHTGDMQMEVIEILKPMITNTRHEIEPKGGKKVTRDICCNFILNTNHKDAIRKTENDRRFVPIYTAQQEFGQLARDGLTGEYFYALNHWLYKENGLAIVADYLETYDIPKEFNPAEGCHRAPVTSSTEAAIHQSRNRAEQEILEAIEEGLPGFRDGWVSSAALDSLLKEHRLQFKYPPNKRRELMQGIGYDWHPHLKEGRVNNRVQPDGKKPRLYIQKGHKNINLTESSLIEKAYSDANK